MKPESIEETQKMITEALIKSNINIYDKMELMLNLFNFLNEYDENIKILKKIPKEK